MDNTFQTVEELCNIFKMIPNCSCENSIVRNMTKQFGGEDVCRPASLRSSDVELAYEPQYSRPIVAVVLVATLFGIFGNALVVILAVKNWKTYIPYQKLIGQLGASDLLFAALHLLSMFHLFWTNKWIYGETMCKILTGSITLSSLFAVGLIFIISLERYIAIVHPFFWKYGGKRLNLTFNAINMCLGIASVVPRFTYLHLTDKNTCAEKWPEVRTELIYELYILIVYFCLPLLAMFYLSFRILYVLRNGMLGSNDCLRDSSGEKSRKNSRTMRILVSIIVAFTILVMPNRVILVYFIYKQSNGERIANDTYTALTFIAMIPYSFHVAINPILYCIIDKSWRKQALDLVCCFRIFYKRGRGNSFDVNSIEATCVKTFSFLGDHAANTQPVTTSPHAGGDVSHDISNNGKENAIGNDLFALNGPNPIICKIGGNNNDYFYGDESLTLSDDMLPCGLQSDDILPYGIQSDDTLPCGLQIPLIPDPDRETIL